MRIFKYLAVGLLMPAVFSISTLQADSMPGTVASAEEAEAVYAARSDFMKGMGGSMRAFSNYLKRDEGEPLELGGMAAELADRAGEIPGLFPKDTGLEQNEESEAKSNIWEEWSDFVAAAERLVEPARAVEAAFDSGDKGTIGQAVKSLGGDGCKGCHSQFREPKE